MNKIGVIANSKRPHAADVFERLSNKAKALGWTLLADPDTASQLPGAQVVEMADLPVSGLDALLSMGGDGTVLFCARLLDGADVPILGINLGSLGFLTAVSEDEMEAALDALDAGTCDSQTRTVADCSVIRNGQLGANYRILNDAVIGFGGSSHIVSLELSVDGAPAALFTCDGMIITTPTGSTGHFLASGGPIIQPASCVFGISVICPHTLSNRPIILPDSSTIEITLTKAHQRLLLAADGQDVEELSVGDRICITRSTKPAHFLYPPNYQYFSVLRQKLHWRGSN